MTVTRAAAVLPVLALFVLVFPGHDYWATGVFCAAMATDWFDGRLARRSGRPSALGSLLDPVADKLLVLSVLVVPVATWALVVALVLTWVSALDYARLAPRLLRRRPVAETSSGAVTSASTFSSTPASRQPLR
ncbi:MAG TPA: CDP-alcohol phosphatidyltransferase family protein [Gaiellaceae bacterium]|nr:CDP-alcohol phosphatidyltransferase family protein [Gaiellaceae bacterium]